MPAIVIGASSVLVWHLTDDLRFYAWGTGYAARCRCHLPARIQVSLFTYLDASHCAERLHPSKSGESYDVEVFDMIALSGHSLKHLLAATGCFLLVSYIQHRRPRQNA